MDRLACVDVPAFPLQLLLKERPDFVGKPAAVVQEDKPQAPLLWVNAPARRLGILPGQRYAAALSLAADLRAGTVSTTEIREGIDALVDLLRAFTPEVETSRTSPGVFWLNAQGLGRLYPRLSAWAQEIRGRLRGARFESIVVVGFTRFGTYAAARSLRGHHVFQTPEEEREAAFRVPLALLEIDPGVRDDLEKLDVRTVGRLLELPSEGLRKRFGDEAHRLHRMACGDLWTPLLPEGFVEPYACSFDIDPPESDVERLLFLIKRPLDALLHDMHVRGDALRELLLHLIVETPRRQSLETSIRPAAPTLDPTQILGLVRLRLESLELPGGIAELCLEALTTRHASEQLGLFNQKPRRNLDAGERAFARLRAELGEQAVVRARLQEAHLPRNQFRWEPLDRATPPDPPEVRERPLVRRIFRRPLGLPPRSRHEPDGWLLRGLEYGPVSAFDGPYILAGGWWVGAGIEREYYFARMKQGEILWIYYDRRQRRWYLEGRIE